MASQYRSIQGIKYERNLLEAADLLTASGRAISKADASKLWEKSKDGSKVTPTERRTLEYIMTTYKMHEAGSAHLRSLLDGKKPAMATAKEIDVQTMPKAMVQDVSMDSDDDDDDDCDFNFDTVAQKAVSAIQHGSGAASSSSMAGRELRELGLDVGLSSEQLYLTGAAGDAFDTTAPPGICTLGIGDYRSGAGPAVPVASVSSRDVRGAPVRPVHDKRLREKEGRIRREEKLSKWFGLPKRKLTPEMEQELQVLKLRSSFDPKRFYKANDSKALPTHFVMATEVGGGRVSAGLAAAPEVRWNSGRSFLDTVLRDAKSQEWTWKKHGEVNVRGHAAFNSGHGKAGNKGRKGLKSTKRGGSWKKNRKG